MWKYGEQNVWPGQGWTDADGFQHPANWNIWSADEKTAHGLIEIVEETPPDSRLYIWSQNADGTITKTPRALDDTGSGDELVQGVKSNLKEEVNKQQGDLLGRTDWYVIRKADKSIAIPDNVQDYRDAIRAKGDEMKAAIEDAASTSEMATVIDSVLYVWPTIE